MVDSFQRSVTYYDIKEKSRDRHRNLTALNAALNSRGRLRGTVIWHTTNAPNNAESQMTSEMAASHLYGINVEMRTADSSGVKAKGLEPSKWERIMIPLFSFIRALHTWLPRERQRTRSDVLYARNRRHV